MSKTSIGRLGEIWKANLNNFLDQLEEPEKMVRQAIRDMEGDVDRTAASVAKALAHERRLEGDYEAAQKQQAVWADRAEQALADGREEEARMALEHKVGFARRAEGMEPALAESRAATSQLKEELVEMRRALEDARNRQGTLIARYQSMDRQKVVEDRRTDGFSRFKELEGRVAEHERDLDRWRREVEEAEAQADVYSDLDRAANESQQADTQARIEEELAALRHKTPKGE